MLYKTGLGKMMLNNITQLAKPLHGAIALTSIGHQWSGFRNEFDPLFRNILWVVSVIYSHGVKFQMQLNDLGAWVSLTFNLKMGLMFLNHADALENFTHLRLELNFGLLLFLSNFVQISIPMSLWFVSDRAVCTVEHLRFMHWKVVRGSIT